MLEELDLEGLEAKRRDKVALGHAVDDRMASLSLAEYFTWYWGPDSDHIKDAIAGKRPFSGQYILNAQTYLRCYVDIYPAFKTTPLRRVTFGLMYTYFRALRSMPQVQHPDRVVSRATIDYIKTNLRGALNWAAARGLCKKIDFTGIMLPASTSRDRGLLTDAEVEKILALPTQALWRETSGAKRLRIDVPPRPRMKGGEKHLDPVSDIDIGMKAFVLLGPFCGFSRVEERGLR
jgi:hypothetical protein